MGKRHELDIENALKQEWQHVLASAANKRLLAVVRNVSIKFQVEVMGEVVLTTGDLRQAAEKYNSA